MAGSIFSKEIPALRTFKWMSLIGCALVFSAYFIWPWTTEIVPPLHVGLGVLTACFWFVDKRGSELRRTRLLCTLACVVIVILVILWPENLDFFPLVVVLFLLLVTICLWLSQTRGRMRRRLKRIGMIVSLVLVIAWVASNPWILFYRGESTFLRIGTGSIQITQLHGPADEVQQMMAPYSSWPSGWSAVPLWCQVPWTARSAVEMAFVNLGGAPLAKYSYLGNSNATTLFAFIPLWAFLVLSATPVLLLYWQDRRVRPPGHCQSCGYNLTGNVSGRCPECGKASGPKTAAESSASQ